MAAASSQIDVRPGSEKMKLKSRAQTVEAAEDILYGSVSKWVLDRGSLTN